MKKLTLMLLVVLVWGCSQAEDSAVKEKAVEAVKTEVTEVKKQAVETVKEQANDVINKATAEVKDQAVEAVKAKAADATDKINADTMEAVTEQLTKPKEPAYQAGVQYTVINPAWDTKSEDVVVYEFYGYLCPHCYSFQPYVKKLESQLPENAKLKRIPVVFRPQWKPFAQAYYTFENMGVLDQVHESLFKAIHQQKKPLRSIEDIADWAAAAHGVDKEKFLSTANSFMVDGLVRQGNQMMQAMGITSTPTLVVNGQYKPNNKALKVRDQVIDVTTYLVQKAAAEQTKAE